MKNVRLQISTTEERALPEGKSFGGFRFTLQKEGGTQNVDVVLDNFVSFGGVPAGTYTATVAAVDSTGENLSTPVEISVVIDEQGAATFLAPTGLVAEFF